MAKCYINQEIFYWSLLDDPPGTSEGVGDSGRTACPPTPDLKD